MKQMKKLKIVYSLLFVVLPLVLMTHGQINNYAEDYKPFLMNDSAASNWTNCSAFLADSTFNISSVVDIDWVTFYFWTFDSGESYTMRFSVPSDLLIERIREVLVQEPEPKVNWSDAALFMDTSLDISGLFIKTDTPGMFRFLPTAMLMEYKITTEILFGFKVVDGYLGFMNCFGKIGYALAPAYNVPKKEEIDKLAAKMNFWNPFGRSYLDTIKEIYPIDDPVIPTEVDDDEEDMRIVIDDSKNTIDMF